MENDLRTANGRSKGIQRLIAFEYPIVPDVRLQELTWLIKLEFVLNHITKLKILVLTYLLESCFFICQSLCLIRFLLHDYFITHETCLSD